MRQVEPSVDSGWLRRHRRLVILVLLIALPIASLVGRWWWVGRQIDLELARIRAAGEPITFEDLNRRDETHATDEEATLLWLTALYPLEGPEFDKATEGVPPFDYEKELRLPGEPWPDRDSAELLLGRFWESLDRLHKGAELNGFARLPGTFEPFEVRGMDYFTQLRNAARLLQLEAHIAAHRGEPDQVTAAILSNLALSRLFLNDRGVRSSIGLNLGYVFEGIAVSVLEPMLTGVSFDDRHLARFQADLRRSRDAKMLYRTLLVERVEGILLFESRQASWEHFQAMKQIGFRSDDTQVAWMVWWGYWSRRDYFEYLRRMRRLVEASKLPLPVAYRRAKAALDDVDQLRARRLLRNKRFLLTPDLVRTATSPFAVLALRAARSRAADAAIGAYRYRAKKGFLPVSLERLVPHYLPEVPEDPFTGEPLRYASEENGYAVYSVGRDGVDDGGKAESSTRPDIVFRVTKPHAE